MREEREKAKMASRFKSKMALKPSKKNVDVTSTTPTRPLRGKKNLK